MGGSSIAAHQKRLQRRATKLANRELRARIAKHGYAAADGRAAAGNVVPLRPSNRRVPAVTASAQPAEKPFLSANPIELRNSEAALTEATNEALAAAMREMAAIIGDPYVKDAVKIQAFAQLVRAKEHITRAHLRAQRHTAWDVDLPNMSSDQRESFENHQRAQHLLAAGFIVTHPDGRVVRPVDRSARMVDD